jgi:hypothetical protein
LDWFLGWNDCSDLIDLMAGEPDELEEASLRPWLEAFNTARLAIKRAGWEGDGRWKFSAVPGDSDDVNTKWVFLVKQDNNGTTWIASPYPLPWLEDLRV